MESMKQTRVQTKFQTPNSMKKIPQFILSISLLSFLLIYFPCLPKNFTSVHVLLFSFLSGFSYYYYHVNKTVVFFLCTGILVYVSSFPGLISSNSTVNTRGDETIHLCDEPRIVETKAIVAWKEDLEKNVAYCLQIAVVEEQEQEEQTEEVAEEGFVGELESDERFEDFIKTMKEVMRREAQQLLLKV